MKEEGKYSYDEIMSNLFKPTNITPVESLKELFNNRLSELNISPTAVLDLLKINYRSLNGILNGTQKTIDLTNLIKIADFLQKPKEIIIKLYLDELDKRYPNESFSSSENIDFIKENFDLTELKRVRFIKNINDFNDIETRIVRYFGLKSIFDYKKPDLEVAFSEGKIKPKNNLSRSTWIKSALDTINQLDNNYEYNKQKLVDYFPKIRGYSTNVEVGLINVIRDLFKLGITVIYQSPFKSLHLRGATFSVKEKPCIILTDYKGFYPTIWFALVHELFHVIFDWDEILSNRYHLSEEETDQIILLEKEEEANDFAREYLFSKEKMRIIRPYLRDIDYVKEFAINNQVHPSFVYVYNAFDLGNSDKSWAIAKIQNPQNFSNLKKQIENPWDNPKPIHEYVRSMKYKFYN